METLLAFHADERQKKLLSNLCASMSAVLSCPGKEQEILPLYRLAEDTSRQPLRPRFSPARPMMLQETVLIFCGFSQLHLDQALSLLCSAGMKQTLKAVLTEDNKYLNILQLYGILTDERRSME